MLVFLMRGPAVSVLILRVVDLSSSGEAGNVKMLRNNETTEALNQLLNLRLKSKTEFTRYCYCGLLYVRIRGEELSNQN